MKITQFFPMYHIFPLKPSKWYFLYMEKMLLQITYFWCCDCRVQSVSITGIYDVQFMMHSRTSFPGQLHFPPILGVGGIIFNWQIILFSTAFGNPVYILRMGLCHRNGPWGFIGTPYLKVCFSKWITFAGLELVQLQSKSIIHGNATVNKGILFSSHSKLDKLPRTPSQK